MLAVFAIANQKGGVGKTTTAVNLAACLAIAGYRCVLIDIDPQGNATSGLGAEKRAEGGADSALLLPDTPDVWTEKTSVDNLGLVPATVRLTSAEHLLRHELDRYRRLRRAIAALRDRFDFAIIDCPPSSGVLTLNALVAATRVIIPVQCEYYAMEGLAHMLETIAIARSEHGAEPEGIGFLFTMHEPGVPLARDVVREVLSHFRNETYKTCVPRDSLLGEAPSHGQPAILYAPRSRGTNAYIQLAREVIYASEQTRNVA